MIYLPASHPIQLNEEDAAELKHLLNRIEQDEFTLREDPRTDPTRSHEHLKNTLIRILDQIPRT